MKSENAIVKFALFVILVTVLTSCLVSNTYAKYTTNVEAADTAIVAKWNVSAEEISQNFSIFDVSSIYDTKNADYTGNGVRETDVKTGTTNGIIAPGTWGKFSFTLPVKKHTIRMIAPIATSIRPKFFKNVFIAIIYFILF